MSGLPAHRRAIREVFRAEAAAAEFRLAITGATGWLGLALANLASECGLTTRDGRLRLFGSTRRTIPLPNEAAAQVEALEDAAALEGPGWRLVHLAGLGQERCLDLSPAEFQAISDGVYRHALRLLETAERPRVIFTSSGAIYRDGGLVEALEQNPYGYMKRRHEAALAELCAEAEIPLVIARVFAVGGPHANKLDRYALSNFLAEAAAGAPIVIKAQGPVFRSFVHVEELMTVLLHLANRAEGGRATPFDTGGREVLELGDLAEVVLKACGRDTGAIERTLREAAAENWYVGEPRAYQAAITRAGLRAVPIQEIVEDMRRDLVARGVLTRRAAH